MTDPQPTTQHPETPYFIPVAFNEAMWNGKRVRFDVTVRPARPAEGVTFAMFLSGETFGKPDDRVSCELKRETLIELAKAAGLTAEDLKGAGA